MFLLQTEFNSDIAARFGNSEEQSLDFLGLPVFDGPGLWKLLVLFGINLLVCWIITHFFYYRKSRRRDYYFTYMLFSTAIFLILYNLQNMKIEVGIALGLFGIFSMIRYRTEQLPIREMTYLFVLIAISIVNGAGMASSYASFIATNVIFILLIWILEAVGMSNRKAQKIITYEKIDLIKPDKREELLSDLKTRTGLDIVKVQVGSIDFLKDIAFLKVTYIPDDPEPNDIDMVTKFKKR
ncbi:MAG: DUF4956 domain-containing protein [Bacteroidales bacterium]|nr:DUF4956 domain-containing protein [Bacteroidales bacterium]